MLERLKQDLEMLARGSKFVRVSRGRLGTPSKHLGGDSRVLGGHAKRLLRPQGIGLGFLQRLLGGAQPLCRFACLFRVSAAHLGACAAPLALLPPNLRRGSLRFGLAAPSLAQSGSSLAWHFAAAVSIVKRTWRRRAGIVRRRLKRRAPVHPWRPIPSPRRPRRPGNARGGSLDPAPTAWYAESMGVTEPADRALSTRCAARPRPKAPARHARRRPASAKRPPPPPGRPQAQPGFPRLTGLSGLRLLVIEDHADTRELLRRMLEPLGAEVWVAENGELALDLLRSRPHSPTAILCDLMMPVMDGLQFTRLLQRNPQWSRSRSSP